MKNSIYNSKTGIGLLIAMIFVVSGCERDLSDDAVISTANPEGEVFIDTFSTGLDYFPFSGTVADAFTLDTETKFSGTASMRFDIPNEGDPLGAFAGAIFRDDAGGRDLSGYDALTFYAKSTTAATINDIGFGQDFFGNEFETTLNNLRLTTNWRKYVIPIPDPSKLTQNRGLLWYAEGPENGNGYTFWLDDVRFEKLGTLAQPRPAIFNGEDVVQQTFTGANTQVTGLTQTLNSANGDITVSVAPGYYEFTSSNPGVATVNANGAVQVIGPSPTDTNGEPIPTIITATLGQDGNGNPIPAAGSLSIVSLGNFVFAPTPTQDQANVISIFSDAYTNVPVVHYNGYFAPFQTTQGQNDITINGDNIIRYTELNFVATEFFAPTVDATEMTHFHVDIQVQDENVVNGDFIRLQLGDFGSDAAFGGGDDSEGRFTLDNDDLDDGGWLSFDVPLSSFTGLTSRENLAQIFFVSDATITDILVDNMYFYKEVVDPTPNVDDSTNTQVVLPIGFESTTLSYNLTDFGGADSAVIVNPVAGPNNPDAASQVLRTTKTAGADFFAGTFTDLDAPIDFSTSTTMRMKVYSPKANIPIRMALELPGGGGQVFVDANVTAANEWVELEFDFSNVINPAATYQRIVVFYEFIPGVPGDGSIYYCDDIKVLN